MSNDLSSNGNQSVKRMRLVARIASVIIIAFSLVMIVGHLVAPELVEEEYPPIENLLPVIASASVFALALAWRWEGLGGALSLGFFLLQLALFWAIRGTFFPLQVLAIFAPLPITAVLFLACWWKSKDRLAVA